ncbi:histidine kinase [Paenibacillus sp. CAA11]|nr:histidine kinase [Paenibacillus sp. CAA11]
MKFRSIRARLVKFMLIVTTLPLVISLLITLTHTRESVKAQSLAENKRLMIQGGTNLSNYLNRIRETSNLAYADPSFLRNLTKGPDDYRSSAEIYTTLLTIQGALPDITQLYLYSRLHKQSTLVTRSLPRREDHAKPYTEALKFANMDMAIEPPHSMHSYGLSTAAAPEAGPVLTFYRSISRIPSKEQIALLAIDLRLDSLNSICDSLYDPEKENIQLVNEQGVIIYSGNPDELGQAMKQPELLSRTGSDNEGYFDGDNAMHIYQRIELPFAKWTLVKSIPHAALYQNSTQLTSINAVIAGLALLTVVFGTLFISFRITRPIKQLARYMNEIQIGRLDIDIQVAAREDEIGVLSRRFRQMMDTINNLILQEYKLELVNKTTQLKALQAQIDPHFLYNSLQSIGTLALQHQAPRVYSLIVSLANIMRYNMRNEEALVPLQQEISYLKLYLELQQERFADRLHITWSLDEESLQALVPKMILQPLAENYFKHGIEAGIQDACLHFSSRITPMKRLIITLENNGASIPPERLEQIAASLTERADSHIRPPDPAAPIGLRNVLARLRLYSDESADLQIENISPQGVRVTLDIPERSTERDESIDCG